MRLDHGSNVQFQYRLVLLILKQYRYSLQAGSSFWWVRQEDDLEKISVETNGLLVWLWREEIKSDSDRDEKPERLSTGPNQTGITISKRRHNSNQYCHLPITLSRPSEQSRVIEDSSNESASTPCVLKGSDLVFDGGAAVFSQRRLPIPPKPTYWQNIHQFSNVLKPTSDQRYAE